MRTLSASAAEVDSEKKQKVAGSATGILFGKMLYIRSKFFPAAYQLITGCIIFCKQHCL